ncbi:glycosyltransferase 87 family protein [Rhodococcus antarcticus]|uniref:Glycosyltransferase 87 family protein n=1 Tax=Rhodococcus antarcticus TaxID=2987751 RepID=A0ABY6NVY7_9NOCA|nr:glycosyltransferase 87 family protein [Rhodococcus antarcticus]UZJ23547.1 glycosyltransferase 87 family protein [Rhodococcus antarcticus]
MPSSTVVADALTRASRTRWFRVLAAVGALAVLVSYLFHPTAYRIDLEVYRAGGRAWLDGIDLYAQPFPTQIGHPLAFTYPPISAVILSPLAWLPLSAANAVWAVLTLALVVATLVVVLQLVGVRARSPQWWWLLTAAFALTARLEPIRSTMGYGQVNVMIMALVAADCLLPRTPWPRGSLVGLVAAIKLTPAVFVLYFLVRKDYRSAATAAASGALVTAAGFVLAPSDSVQYWTTSIFETDRIGQLTYASNQNIQGVLARAGLTGTATSILWVLLSLVTVAVGFQAMRRAQRAGLPALVLVLNGVVGLLVSPVSWSHHWVWAMPALLVLGLVVLATRSRAAAVLGVLGFLVFAIAPQWRLPNDNTSGVEISWAVWQKVVGNGYVWWGAALLVVCALVADRWGTPAVAPVPADDAEPARVRPE